MNKNKLLRLLKVQSESYNQFRMFAHIIREVNKIPGCSYYTDNGNLYVVKGNADIFPCVVSHMDTVHDIVDDLHILQVGDNLTGFNRVTMSQTGIGGDDKNGIFVCLEVLEMIDNIKVVFFRDEEVGCEGSYNADLLFFDNCSFVLQCDRKGKSDIINNASGTELCSKEFIKDNRDIVKKYGYNFTFGMMTDVMALKEIGLNISCANISCGYYNPHQANEFINLTDLQNCLNMVLEMINILPGKQYLHKREHKKPIYTKQKKQSKIFEDTFLGRHNWDSYLPKKKANNFAPSCADCCGPDPEKNGLCKTCNEYYYSAYNIKQGSGIF